MGFNVPNIFTNVGNPIIDANAVNANFASISSVFNYIFDVCFYGAVGNGTTDDSAAIQAAINAAVSHGYGTVFFPRPASTYLVNTTLTCSSPIQFLSNGASITGSANPLISVTGIQSTAALTGNYVFNGLVFLPSAGNVALLCDNLGSLNPGFYGPGPLIKDCLFSGELYTSASANPLFHARSFSPITISDSAFIGSGTGGGGTMLRPGLLFEGIGNGRIAGCDLNYLTVALDAKPDANGDDTEGIIVDSCTSEGAQIFMRSVNNNGAFIAKGCVADHVGQVIISTNDYQSPTFSSGFIGYSPSIAVPANAPCIQVLANPGGTPAYDGTGGVCGNIIVTYQTTGTLISLSNVIGFTFAQNVGSSGGVAVYLSLANFCAAILVMDNFLQFAATSKTSLTSLSTNFIYVRNDFVLSPVGSSAAATTNFGITWSVPASATASENLGPSDATVYISGGTVTAISVNGQSTGLTSGAFRVPTRQTITVTYSVAPNWNVVFD